MERRLAAILAADVVGYSHLIREDEAGTLAVLRAHREQLIEPKVAEHKGRIVKLMGDGLLVEFPSAVEAVRCAVEIQHLIGDRDEAVPEGKRVTYRIGINIGDIVVEDDDIYGDGVNVAARLEGLADPGGICMARNVYDQVADKLDLTLEHQGAREVKNITEPVTVYRVVLDDKAAALVAPLVQDAMRPATRRRMAVLVATLVLLSAVGGTLWWQPWVRGVDPASVQQMAFPLPQQPSVAVLPFDNLTGDAELDILVDGLVEEVIFSLSKIPRLFVIARNSTFTYKGKAVKVNRVAEELGVRFVLEGSVRASGDRMRITAQLIDAVEGHHVWAESYDRQIGDILSLQSEIAQMIVKELDVELVSGELARLQRGTTSSSEAYAIFLRAEAAPRNTKENVLSRIKLYETALELDPSFAAAWAAMAIDYARMGRIGLEDRDLAYAKAQNYAGKAVAADSTYSGAYLALSTVHRFRGEFEESLALVEKALSLAPSDANAILYKGRMLRLLPGRAEEAISTIKSAMRLNPYYPANYLSQLSWAYFAAGRYQEAHDVGLEYVKRQPNRDHAHWRLAMTYSILGHPEKAELEVEETLRLNPNRTIAKTLKLSPYALSNPALIGAEIDAMRAAGFPEK
jgi:adenylate cyclase